MIHRVVTVADGAGIQVTVCGEMAGVPDLAAALLAIGVRRLSMGVDAIPEVKKFIRSLRMEQLQKLGPKLLELDTGSEIRARLKEVLPVIT
jgi:phosphoenolpyruvate-protein kinase (PTS system EI component)